MDRNHVLLDLFRNVDVPNFREVISIAWSGLGSRVIADLTDKEFDSVVEKIKTELNKRGVTDGQFQTDQDLD